MFMFDKNLLKLMTEANCDQISAYWFEGLIGYRFTKNEKRFNLQDCGDCFKLFDNLGRNSISFKNVDEAVEYLKAA